MGIRNIYATLEAAIEAIAPTSYPERTFAAVDSEGATPTLEDSIAIGRRPFDLGAASPPVDDGEAGAPDAGTLRLRQSCVARFGYLLNSLGPRRDVDVVVSEDVAAIRTALMTPANWSTAPELISLEPPGVPLFERDDHRLIVSVPFEIIYREV